MKIASILVLIVCVALPFATISPSVQAAANDSKTVSIAKQSVKLKVSSRTQAIRLAQRQYQGKVLKAQSKKVNRDPGYRVKMLSKEGLVFDVFVDAKTGRISRK